MSADQTGPMPWRLQLAARFIADGFESCTVERQGMINAFCLQWADALIAAHLATAPKCGHPAHARVPITDEPDFSGGTERHVGTACALCGQNLA